jgi:hypothetical protein
VKKKGLRNNEWISKIKIEADIPLQHIPQNISLWMQLRTINLHEGVPNGIYLGTSLRWSILLQIRVQMPILWGNRVASYHRGLEDLGTSQGDIFAWLAVKNRF